MEQDRLKVQEKLCEFYKRWASYTGTEVTGSQTFLNEFFECFGVKFDPNNLPFEHRDENDGYADCYIRNVCIIEMKNPTKYGCAEKLRKEYPQIERYWHSRGKAAPYLVLCNFKDFLVTDTRNQETHHIKIGELAAHVDSFAFIMGMNPTFKPLQEVVNKEAASKLGEIYRSITKRHPDQEQNACRFIMQCLFCMYAEKTGYLEGLIFSRCVKEIVDGVDTSSNILGTLFLRLDDKNDDTRKVKGVKVSRFNSTLFASAPDLLLKDNEAKMLFEACNVDWAKISPEIFGVIFESVANPEEKRNTGIAYTYAEDIMKVVKPCIVDYWEEKIANCNSSEQWRNLHKEIRNYRILDPACGSGNFLLIAYREIKRIEARIFKAYAASTNISYESAQKELGWFELSNIHGIEIKPFSAFLTKVSLWIAKKQMASELGLTEPLLPLDDLKHILGSENENGVDALFVRWPDVDVVIGNPPYCGAKRIKKTRGEEYIKNLKERFPDHNMMADYCSFWYQKVIEEIRAGVRVGMVSTNTIRQTNTRESSLEQIIATGGEIFNAIYEQKWSGTAKVFVSIVNFVNKSTYSGQKFLDNKPVDIISSRLLSFQPQWEAKHLDENDDIAFVGCQPTGDGFFLDDCEANALLRKGNNKECIVKYLGGKDINQTSDSSPQRYIIDFHDWPLEKCKTFKDLISIIEAKVKPDRDLKERKSNREDWWKYAETRPLMRKQVLSKTKFIAICMRTKYPVFAVIDNSEKNIIPANTAVVIAWKGWQQFGILQSIFHKEWFDYQCSTLKADPSYNNTFVFETFPFPDETNEQVETKGEMLHELRKSICIKEDFGLTELYNQIADGGYKEIQKLQNELDKAVAKSYGFPVSKLHNREAIIRFLLDENRRKYEEQENLKTVQKAG